MNRGGEARPSQLIPGVRPIGAAVLSVQEEMQMKQYRVQSMAMYWLFVVVIPCLFLAAGALFIWLAVSRPAQGLPSWFLLIWLVGVAVGIYKQATMPYAIALIDSGFVRFVGAFRTCQVPAAAIASVVSLGGSFVQVKHAGGRIMMLNQITGLHEFLTELKRMNPNVQIKGL